MTPEPLAAPSPGFGTSPERLAPLPLLSAGRGTTPVAGAGPATAFSHGPLRGLGFGLGSLCAPSRRVRERVGVRARVHRPRAFWRRAPDATRRCLARLTPAEGHSPLYTLHGDEPLLQQEAADAIRAAARAQGYTDAAAPSPARTSTGARCWQPAAV